MVKYVETLSSEICVSLCKAAKRVYPRDMTDRNSIRALGAELGAPPTIRRTIAKHTSSHTQISALIATRDDNFALTRCGASRIAMRRLFMARKTGTERELLYRRMISTDSRRKLSGITKNITPVMTRIRTQQPIRLSVAASHPGARWRQLRA